MPINFADVFSDDAFSLVSLTDAVNKIDHVPGRAGELAFASVGGGIATTEIVIEQKAMALTIIPTSTRGAPSPVETRDKRTAIKLDVPHIQLEDVVNASSIQNVRAFGSGALETVQGVVNDQLGKMVNRMDLTLEHKRLGALKGEITDSDGSIILNLYSAFGVGEPAPVVFPSAAASESVSLRAACQSVIRQLHRSVKLITPQSAKVWGLCGDDFFDQLVSHPDVAAAFEGWSAAQAMLASDATATRAVLASLVLTMFSNERRMMRPLSA
jgi:Phage major capsid protein E